MLLNILLTQKLKDTLAFGYENDAIFLDCIKAFDRVNHGRLLERLKV